MPGPPSALDVRRPRVVVAGGGVGAVEAVLALRALSGARTAIELVAPTEEFVYRPLAVAEPFGYAPARRLPLARLARTHGVHHHRAAVTAVDAQRCRVELAGGGELGYDGLIVALGARPRDWLPGALTFGGPQDVAAYRGVLEEVEAGAVGRLLFAAPPGVSWTLPLYELALLTAAWAAERRVIGLRLLLATPEATPLEVFGPAAARTVRDLLGDRGIELLAQRQVTATNGRNVRLADGSTLTADRVVTMPRLTGNPVPGLPRDADGFIPTDAHGAVEGMTDVYAVGDATTFPVKQGGLAAQQADAAAAAIAAAAGVPVDEAPFEPVMRGLLLTGVTSAYLRADPSAAGAEGSIAAFNPLWWPPTKIAGRYLAPYLADQPELAGTPELAEREPAPDEERARRDREELRRLALAFAHADAEEGDHRSGLRWLQVLERMDGVLRPEHEALRRRWTAEA